MVYTSDTLRCFLQEVSDSNLTPSAKVTARQLAADAITLSAKVQALQGELAKLQQQRVNEPSTNPPAKNPNGTRETPPIRTGRDPSASSVAAAQDRATGARPIPNRTVLSITRLNNVQSVRRI